MSIVETELSTGEHKLKTALAVLRLASLSLTPTGPVEADAIIQAAANHRESMLLTKLTTPGFSAVERELWARADEQSEE